MEVKVRQEESSDEGISMKKSSEEEDLLACSPLKCNEEKKESEDIRKNSETNDFSLERKMSFKELRRRIEEICEVPSLKSRRGQVSLVMECKGELKNDGQNETSEAKKTAKEEHQEAKVKPIDSGDLHLSHVTITKWTTPKQNDADALLRLKQVCGTLEGDSIYHYENIDDFDDIVDNRKSPNDKQWKSRLFLGSNKGQVSCKLQWNQKGFVSRALSCNGEQIEDADRLDLRSYFLGEIARGVEIIPCLKKGCTNFYDPWDVVLVTATKDANVWYHTIAINPINRRNKAGLLTVARGRDLFQMNGDSSKSTEALESEPKELWWKRKRKSKKIKYKEFPKKVEPKTSKLSESMADNDTKNEPNVKPLQAKQFKHECSTCLEGFDDELEPGSPSCGHYTCKLCLNQYFKEQVGNMITSIECPRLDCKEKFNTLFILAILNNNTSFQNAFMKLHEKRNELDYEGKMSKSDKACHEWGNRDKHPPGDQEQLGDNAEDKDAWIGKSNDYKRCPKCNTLTEKDKRDGACNIVICKFCLAKFCWLCKKKCNEGLHMFQCPLYGNKKFSKRRKIVNYFGYSSGLAVGVPLVGGLVLGTGIATLGTLIVLGSLSPPVFLAKKVHKYHKHQKSSAHLRRLSIIAGISLGILSLPVLSVWGVYKTLNASAKNTLRLLDRFLPQDDHDADPLQQTTRKAVTKTCDHEVEPEGGISKDAWSVLSHGSETQVILNNNGSSLTHVENSTTTTSPGNVL